MGKVEVAVRPARLQDYQAVMAITGEETLFGGFDYLSSRYQIYLQDKVCYCYVAEYQDKIVAFAIYHVIDNGTSVLAEGGRVVKELQRKGILAQIAQYALPRVRHQVPTAAQVVHVAGDTPDIDRPLKMIRESKAREKIVFRSHILAYKNDLAVVRSRIAGSTPGEDHGDPPLPATADKMAALLLNTSNIVNLFPTGYFTAGQNWMPLRAWSSNILLTTQRHTTLISEPAPNTLSALSFGFVNQVVFGTRYDVYYYGEANTSTLTCHMVQHLRRAVELCLPNQKLGVMLHFPGSCDKAAVKAALMPYMGTNLKSPYFKQEGCYLFEGPLPPSTNLIKSRI